MVAAAGLCLVSERPSAILFRSERRPWLRFSIVYQRRFSRRRERSRQALPEGGYRGCREPRVVAIIFPFILILFVPVLAARDRERAARRRICRADRRRPREDRRLRKPTGLNLFCGWH